MKGSFLKDTVFNGALSVMIFFVLTIYGLDTIDVILGELNITTEDVVGVHQSPNISRMREPKRMAQFMSSNTIQVVI